MPVDRPAHQLRADERPAHARAGARRSRGRSLRLAHRDERDDGRRALRATGRPSPPTTKVAAVGETTAAALLAVGYRVDLVPERDNSAAGMAEQMIALEPEPRDILTLRSEIAKPVLTRMLSEAGHRVRSVVAYRTVGVPVTDRIAEDVRSGRINAILVTSGSVAEQVQRSSPTSPDDPHRRDRPPHREGRPARGPLGRRGRRHADRRRAHRRRRPVHAAARRGRIRSVTARSSPGRRARRRGRRLAIRRCGVRAGARPASGCAGTARSRSRSS